MQRTKHLEAFYVALGQQQHQFEHHVKTQFLDQLSKWQIFGGASSQQAKAAIQEAIDALVIYENLGRPQAQLKKTAFIRLLGQAKRTVPQPSPNVRQISDDMKRIQAQYNVLTRKFMLLDYWQAVAMGDTEPDMPEDGEHWALHYFLNFDPLKVRPILELMHADAVNVLRKRHWDATLETWYGVDATKNVTYDKTAISTTLKAEALARVGAEIKGEFAVEYEGFKLKATAEAFAGARAQASGQLHAQSGPNFELSAKGEVEVECGIRIKANVNVDVLDVLEAEAGVDAIAGAMAKAEAECTVSYQGVKMKVSAEFFAGAKVTGTAKGTLKLGGRSIFGAEVEASASAGFGAEASAEFECGLFGKVSMGAKAGVTVGLGASVGTTLNVDFHNIAWGAANSFWVLLNEAGFKNGGKTWFLPVEENVEMCKKVRDSLFKMMGDIYNQNEGKVSALDDWNLIERRITSAPMGVRRG